MVADVVKSVPSRPERSAMKQTSVTLTKDFTVTTLQTGLGMKQEYVHVSYSFTSYSSNFRGVIGMDLYI